MVFNAIAAMLQNALCHWTVDAAELMLPETVGSVVLDMLMLRICYCNGESIMRAWHPGIEDKKEWKSFVVKGTRTIHFVHRLSRLSCG